MTDHQRQLAAMKAGMKARHLKLGYLYAEARVGRSSVCRWASAARTPQPDTWQRLCTAYTRITGETV